MPGEGLRIVVLRGILDQISQNQVKLPNDRLNLAELRIVVSARLAGSNVFSAVGTESDLSLNQLLLRVTWLPQGFSEQKVKQVLDGFVSVYHFLPRGEPRLPTRADVNPIIGTIPDLHNSLRTKNEKQK